MNRIRKLKKIGIGFWILLGIAFAQGQEISFNHPELAWYSLETEHFVVHFHQGTERTARRVAEIAESIYSPITSLYDYIPDTKIHWIIRDHDDESNGATFYYENKIEIWCSALDFVFRGTHDWLYNVVAHEFTHMISLGSARKFPRQIPGIYFQWLGYEKEKRKDVIHGYPNRIVSYPIAGTVIPMWFAEGMAQFQYPGLEYDFWDSHRDMLLRTAVLENRLLSLSEMHVFGKNSLGNERVYNQGFALTLYMAHQYGEAVLAELTQAMKLPWRMDFSSAVRQVLKRSESALYQEWKQWLKTEYAKSTEVIDTHPVEGKILQSKGLGNFTPVWSPEGTHYAYVSTQGGDFLSQTVLWIVDAQTGKGKPVVGGVAPYISWSPDGHRIAYAKRMQTKHGSHYFDAFVYDIMAKKEKRITRGMRFRHPAWSSDGNWLLGVVEQDGTCNLVLVSLTGEKIRKLSHFEHGEQIYGPQWLKEAIVFAVSDSCGNRDIAMLDTASGRFSYLLQTPADERDPFPSPTGASIYFASDRTGIFNIYQFNMTTGEIIQHTNVKGGAFMPCVNEKGELLYSLFQSEGYKIAKIDSLIAVPPEWTSYQSPYAWTKKDRDLCPKPLASQNFAFSPKSYKPIYSKLMFLPRFFVDYPNMLKVGTYFYGNDILEKTSLFGSVAVNGRFDSDVSLLFQYKKWYPTLFFEGYHLRRHTSSQNMQFEYTLMEMDLGAEFPLTDQMQIRTLWQGSRYDAEMHLMTKQGKMKIPYTYHKGQVFRVEWQYRSIFPKAQHTAPVKKREILVQVDRAAQQFLKGFKIHSDYGTLVETYRRYNYFQFFIDWNEVRPLFFQDHSVGVRVRAGLIDRPVESFYYFFGGGLEGMRGYSYYSLEGTKLLQLGLSYRFPIVRKMDQKILWMHLNRFFGVVYGHVGDAWTGHTLSFSDLKKDVGFQLRMSLYSFYGFPLCVFWDIAYGLDRVKTSQGLLEGQTWRTYFGILFDFVD